MKGRSELAGCSFRTPVKLWETPPTTQEMNSKQHFVHHEMQFCMQQNLNVARKNNGGLKEHF
jgi:hypothetical protein